MLNWLGAAPRVVPTDFDEPAVLVVLHDARVDVAVGDEDVALRVPGHVGRPAEQVLLRRRRRQRAVEGALDRLGPPAEHHHDAALGVELDDHVRPLVHDPDVVVLVDADRVRELEAVEALADLADEVAVLVELEQARVAAARVDEDVALRIGGDADALAEIQVRRQLEEVRHRRERDLGNVLGLGLRLREQHGLAELVSQRRRGQSCHDQRCGRGGKMTPHVSPPGANLSPQFSCVECHPLALRVFSTRTLVAARDDVANRALVASIVRGRTSSFVSTDFLF